MLLSQEKAHWNSKIAAENNYGKWITLIWARNALGSLCVTIKIKGSNQI